MSKGKLSLVFRARANRLGRWLEGFLPHQRGSQIEKFETQCLRGPQREGMLGKMSILNSWREASGMLFKLALRIGVRLFAGCRDVLWDSTMILNVCNVTTMILNVYNVRGYYFKNSSSSRHNTANFSTFLNVLSAICSISQQNSQVTDHYSCHCHY